MERENEKHPSADRGIAGGKVLVLLPRCVMWIRSKVIGRAFGVVLCGVIGTPAWSADYKIDYAIKSDIGEEVGAVDSCEFNRPCRFEAKSLGYELSARIYTQNPRRAYLHAIKGLDCCLFSGATPIASLQIAEEKVAEVFLFSERNTRGSRLMQGGRVGVLYLHFSFLRN